MNVESERDLEAAPPAYSSVRMDFTFRGITEGEAKALVAEFTHVCPIYYTIASATTMTVSVSVPGD